MSEYKREMIGISNDGAEIVEDCEHVAEIANKYGYDILCDDETEKQISADIEPDESDPNCNKAKKVLERFGYEVVCE